MLTLRILRSNASGDFEPEVAHWQPLQGKNGGWRRGHFLLQSRTRERGMYLFTIIDCRMFNGSYL